MEKSYISELEQAQRARAQGKEAQARVCARRAAGLAIKEYLLQKGIEPTLTSAYDLLHYIQTEALLPPDLKPIAEHLTLRVNEEFKLPVDADLIEEARTLCEWLLKQKQPER